MRFVIFASLVLCVSGAAEAKSKLCLADHAVYQMDDAKGFTIKFVNAKEPTAYSQLDAILTTPTRSFAFSFTASNGYSFNYLVPRWKDAAADADFHLFLFDNKMKTLELPQMGKAAPPFLLTPELGTFLWYGEEPREFLPANMWHLQGCG
jgi:hypothetical protein